MFSPNKNRLSIPIILLSMCLCGSTIARQLMLVSTTLPCDYERQGVQACLLFNLKWSDSGKPAPLKLLLRIPAGSGVARVMLWPQYALVAVQAMRWKDENSNTASGTRYQLINILAPEKYMTFWMGAGWDMSMAVSSQNSRVLITKPLFLPPGPLAGTYLCFHLNLLTGEVKRVHPRRIQWDHVSFPVGRSGPFARSQQLLHVAISQRGILRYFFPNYHPNRRYLSQWRMSPSTMKLTAGMVSKYLVLIGANARQAMLVAPNSLHGAEDRTCIMVLNKAKRQWFVYWIQGVAGYSWTFDQWDVVQQAASNGKGEWPSTGSYWFCNAATGQTWHQFIGRHWNFLWLYHHAAIFRHGDAIYRLPMEHNHLGHPKLLIRDKRLRYAYWACPIPKAAATQAGKNMRFFWEKPRFKLPKELQRPRPPAATQPSRNTVHVDQ